MQRWVTTGFLYAGSDVDEENEGEECSTSSVASVDHWTISNKLLGSTTQLAILGAHDARE